MNEEWVETTLGACYELIAARREATTLDRNTPYFGLEHMAPDCPVVVRGGVAADVSGQVTTFQEGDTLFGRLRPYLRKVALAGLDGVCSPEILVLRPRSDRVEPRFLQLLASSERVIASAIASSAGSRMPRTAAGDLAAITISLPPLPVQRRIADLMAHLDDHLANLRAEREQVAVLREATLATRLGAGMAAERTTLGELLSQDGGSLITGPFGTTLKASEYANEGVPVISVGEIGAGALKVRPDTPRVCTGTIARLPQYVLTAGDIVFARKGAIDRSAIVKPSEAGYFLGSDGLRLRFQDLQLGAFIAAQLTGSSAARWLRQNAGGTTMPSLSQTTLRRLPIVLPSAASQAQIAQQMEAFDYHLERLTREIDALQSAISALLASLLTQKSCIANSYDSLLPGVA